jgi:hypothetical protein
MAEEIKYVWSLAKAVMKPSLILAKRTVVTLATETIVTVETGPVVVLVTMAIVTLASRDSFLLRYLQELRL